MKLKYFYTVFCVLMFSGFATRAQFGGGNGTAGNPYQISTAEHLAALATNVNNGNQYKNTYFKVMNNIDLTQWIETNSPQMGWNPIGEYYPYEVNKSFCGKFDGNNYVISGMFIFRPAAVSTGLFGYIDKGAIVKNIYLKGTSITSGTSISDKDTYSGGIIGFINLSGTQINPEETPIIIENCVNTVSITGGNGNIVYTGGIVGYCYTSKYVETYSSKLTIHNCYNKGDIKGGTGNTTFTGGITGLGQNYDLNDRKAIFLMISSCNNYGNIIGRGVNISVGGISGIFSGEMSYCCNNGSISANSTGDLVYAGGISGNFAGGEISDCYNSGFIFANSTEIVYVGGITGTFDGEMSYCFNSGAIATNTSQLINAGGINGSSIGSIISCSNTGNIDGGLSANSYIGGITGDCSSYENDNCIKQCYVKTHISGYDNIGGIAGYLDSNNIVDCYTAVEIKSNKENPTSIGSIVGEKNNSYGSVRNNYFDNTLCPYPGIGSGGSGGTAGYPTEQMRQSFIYIDWNFSPSANMWNIWENRTYPYFQWQSTSVADVRKNGNNIDFELRNNVDSVTLFKLVNNQRVKKQTTGTLNAGLRSLPITVSLNETDTVLLVVYEPQKLESYPIYVKDFPIVGIPSNQISSSTISISPNPATTKLYLKRSDTQPIDYTVYNTVGQTMIQGMISENSDAINIETLIKGIYLLKINGKENAILKFIKE